MSKRFTETELWIEDWFLGLPKEYMLFWIYIKDKCDHAGIWKPNVTAFNKLSGSNVTLAESLKLFNEDKERIIKLSNGRLFLTGFIRFQYGTSLNTKSRTHQSVLNILKDNEVNLTSLRPQVEVIVDPNVDLNNGVKDKDKDKDKDSSLVQKQLTETKTKETKHKYGEFNNVYLTDSEVQKLRELVGDSNVQPWIEKLSEGIKMKGYKYADHYLVIRNWFRKDNEKLGFVQSSQTIMKNSNIPYSNTDTRMKCSNADCFGRIDWKTKLCLNCKEDYNFDSFELPKIKLSSI